MVPICKVCRSETPITCFFLLREYKNDEGRYWYFCSPDHLLHWLNEQEDIARFERKETKILVWAWEMEAKDDA